MIKASQLISNWIKYDNGEGKLDFGRDNRIIFFC